MRVIVAGGGTGGHLFPGVAVAEECKRRHVDCEVLFVGTGRPVEAAVLAPRGLALRTISAAGIKGKSLLARIGALARIPWGAFQSWRILTSFKPDVVLGVGGYVSGPVVLMAWVTGRLTAVLEQNSLPGLANRMLGRVVDVVFIAYDAAAASFPAEKTVMTGVPIRKETLAAAAGEREPHGGAPVILVVGGSQGSHAINMAAVDAIRILAGRAMDFSVIHQTGSADREAVEAAYREMGVSARVHDFIQEMDRVYREADLAICRAGALTVAEISVMGLPALIVPLPTAADNHQEINARALSEAGAAVMIRQSELTPELLAGRIASLIENGEKRAAMAEAARQAARPDAAIRICEFLEARLSARRGGVRR